MAAHRRKTSRILSTKSKKRGKKKNRRKYIIRRTVAVIILLALLAAGLAMLVRVAEPETVPECTPFEIEAAAEKGREAGESVATTAAGTMAREAAILEVRNRERAIREAGFPSAADAFAAAAEDAMRKNGVLQ